MPTERPDKPPAQTSPPKEESESKKTQADQQSDTEPFDAPKDGVEAQKPDLKDTERKIETFGAAGIAAAIFQTIPH
jgi:hypothetical protein